MGNSDIGLIGLGTMGQALALNIAEKGFDIAVWNRTTAVTQAFAADAGDLAARITPTESLPDLVAALKTPRMILLMVPAGDAVDQQIQALLPLLSKDDLIIDAGNANFNDTNRRMAELPLPFLGIGVSGGEEGARHGPSIMGGGPRANWDRAAPILTAIAARYKDTPCADWMGEAGAGHFVKTVHNGIEYADMQLIAEVYGIMRDGLGMSADQVAAIFERWNDGPLQSYLVEITAKVAAARDGVTAGPVLDVIVDAAGQKGTGRWTAIEAQHLGAPIPVIDAAVTARNISARRDERAEMQEIFGAGPQRIQTGAPAIEVLEQALICGKILCYDQGFGMIAAASRQFGWSLDSAAIARVWRAGCIIRSAMLDDMASALGAVPDARLMAAPFFADWLKRTEGALRQVVSLAALNGIAVPAHSAALAYFDAMRTARGTANMLQGQRDYFGRHGFERLDDGKSGQHGPWADQD
ncbi:NADP-dependent phosphogluconate dehydrogenase [Paracoccus sp. M683]|uniref:NADP-dependent phosphogluconate dehydrogenase n=1 Tax=Paracoccus sp. M683 TaxID=2594268 RepID=UPI00117BF2AF|nr:NADP-dependent phosphogluconate dehydrogenase [Paracoccus sp. M683]TRW96026.1 NADP-dependent phosphogluconate dehydrogenase [Paracoccus sp. M683]